MPKLSVAAIFCLVVYPKNQSIKNERDMILSNQGFTKSSNRMV